ncbi:MAG: hypothetical protein OHK0013_30720 [Sandaracinaceae bacterium]
MHGGDVSDALPGHGSLAVPSLRQTVSASFVGTGSYGLNIDAAGAGSTHHRLSGSVAAAVHVVPWLAIGARISGRYDVVAAGGASDDGLFGYPSLSLRASAKPIAGCTMGLDVQAMVFGSEAPSFELASTSLLLRALFAYAIDLGGASFVLTFNGGHFLDNSRAAAPRSVTDNLSVEDRVSLGTSDSGAIVLGVRGLYASESAEVFADVGYRLYVDGAVIGQSPLRFGVGTRLWAVPEVFFLGLAVDVRATSQAASLASAGVTTVPIEPGFVASLTLGARVGVGTRPADLSVGREDTEDHDAAQDAEADVVPTLGIAVGRVADADGAAVAGASIELVSEVDGSRRTATSDGDGRWEIGNVRNGTAR